MQIVDELRASGKTNVEFYCWIMLVISGNTSREEVVVHNCRRKNRIHAETTTGGDFISCRNHDDRNKIAKYPSGPVRQILRIMKGDGCPDRWGALIFNRDALSE